MSGLLQEMSAENMIVSEHEVAVEITSTRRQRVQ